MPSWKTNEATNIYSQRFPEKKLKFRLKYQPTCFMQFGFSLSNWQKVHLNTDLFSDTQKYLYTNEFA